MIASTGLKIGVERQRGGELERVGCLETFPDPDRACRCRLGSCDLTYLHQRGRHVRERPRHVRVVRTLGFFTNGERTFEERQCLSRPPLLAVDIRKIRQYVRHVRVVWSQHSLVNGHRARVVASRALEVAEPRVGIREHRQCARHVVMPGTIKGLIRALSTWRKRWRAVA